MTMVRRSTLLVAACVAAAPALAEASNTRHVRTPVHWEGAGGECRRPEIVPTCMTLVDRPQGEVLHLPYGIPFEDTMVTPDEVSDSRTHQFFAFCRGHQPEEALPTWIAPADVDAAVAAGLLKAGMVDPSDVLDTSTAWQDCFVRINADAERRPITCEMSDAGVDWDLSGLPAGVYSVEGYTHEPVMGLWITRPGVVKVHDGDPDAVGPAAAIMTGDLTPYRNDTVVIEGCVDAIEGSTATVSWAIASDDIPIEWVAYGEAMPVSSGSLEFEFDPPDALNSETGVLRIVVDDPEGRSTTGYMPGRFNVVDLDNPMSCGEGGGFIGGEHCNESSSGSGGSTSDPDGGSSSGADGGTSSSTGGTGGTTAPIDPTEPEGCGCRTMSSFPFAWPGILGTLVLLLRRRRPRASAA